MKKPRLVKDWKSRLKHYSTIALAMASGLQGAWMSIPDSIKQPLPGWVAQAVAWITLAVVVGGLGGKFVDQSKDGHDSDA